MILSLPKNITQHFIEMIIRGRALALEILIFFCIWSIYKILFAGDAESWWMSFLFSSRQNIGHLIIGYIGFIFGCLFCFHGRFIAIIIIIKQQQNDGIKSDELKFVGKKNLRGLGILPKNYYSVLVSFIAINSSSSSMPIYENDQL